MNKPVSMLALRRIEADILGDVYDTLLERHGVREAESVVEAVVKKSAVTQGKSMRSLKKADDSTLPDFQDFADLIPLWEADGALEIELLNQSTDRLEFNVTHCKFSRMYQEMGLGEIGHLLSCNRDAAFCTGFNPQMQLTRTQTIMKGARYCDFRYQMKDDEGE